MSDWFYILENINIYFKLTAKLKKNKVYELTVTEYMEAAVGWLPQGTTRDPVGSQVLGLPSSRGHFRVPPWHVAFLSPIHHPHAMGLLPHLLLYTQVLGCPPSPTSIYAPHYLKNITQIPIPGSPVIGPPQGFTSFTQQVEELLSYLIWTTKLPGD